jgi:hypothetical protein
MDGVNTLCYAYRVPIRVCPGFPRGRAPEKNTADEEHGFIVEVFEIL